MFSICLNCSIPLNYVKAISLISFKCLTQECFLWLIPTGRRTNQFHFFLQLICYTKFRGDFFADFIHRKKSQPLNIYLPYRSMISRRLNKMFFIPFCAYDLNVSSRSAIRCQGIHSNNCELSINFRCNSIKWPLQSHQVIRNCFKLSSKFVSVIILWFKRIFSASQCFTGKLELKHGTFDDKTLKRCSSIFYQVDKKMEVALMFESDLFIFSEAHDKKLKMINNWKLQDKIKFSFSRL